MKTHDPMGNVSMQHEHGVLFVTVKIMQRLTVVIFVNKGVLYNS